MNRLQSFQLCTLLAVPMFAAGQSQSASPFQVKYTADGISSLQKVQDKYATDYIQSGHALGDVSIRYRAEGADDWNDVQQEKQSSIAVNTFNQTTFQPVTTTGIRVEVQLAPDASAGMLQWRLNDEPARIVRPVDDLQASENFETTGDALVWSITI